MKKFFKMKCTQGFFIKKQKNNELYKVSLKIVQNLKVINDIQNQYETDINKYNKRRKK